MPTPRRSIAALAAVAAAPILALAGPGGPPPPPPPPPGPDDPVPPGAFVKTVRFDLVEAPLAAYNLELTLDVPFLDAIDTLEILSHTLHIEFQTNTFAGEYDAADMGLIIQSPVDNPDGPFPVKTAIITGESLGFSGNGLFTATVDLPILNGKPLPPAPGVRFTFYGFTHFHAPRLIDPSNETPMGGQHVGSYLEVEYLVIPPAPTAAPLLAGLALAARRRRA